MSASGPARDGAICPSCERFIGTASSCPFCDADTARRLNLRLFRYGALALAFAGLAMLYLMARHREVAQVKVGDMDPAMNFAYIRVVGEVADSPRAYPDVPTARYLGFHLDDGTGRIRIVAYDRLARELLEPGRLPRKGDRLAVAGSLRMGAEAGPQLIVQVSGAVTRCRASGADGP
ncbi:MAG: OB-fold nucleic acid binding domain-containing protein [Kiritimatiellae bacterium]|nr:OB-fold nucleic acid binding domain-containing protein [Kiritimatiellia bacterium]